MYPDFMDTLYNWGCCNTWPCNRPSFFHSWRRGNTKETEKEEKTPINVGWGMAPGEKWDRSLDHPHSYPCTQLHCNLPQHLQDGRENVQRNPTEIASSHREEHSKFNGFSLSKVGEASKTDETSSARRLKPTKPRRRHVLDASKTNSCHSQTLAQFAERGEFFI